MAVFIIGDVHGHYEPLRRLVDRLAPGPEDVLIQMGDCINRGPDSFEVVEFWRQFSRCSFYVLGGNHEELMYDYLAEGSRSLVDETFGGVVTVESYQRHGWACKRGDPSSIPPEHWEFYLQTLPWTRPYLITSSYLFTHAGWDFSASATEQNPHTLRWGKVWNWKMGLPTVVRGHTPRRKVAIRRGLIEVDTGCGLGGPLSGLRLPEETVTVEWPEGAKGLRY